MGYQQIVLGLVCRFDRQVPNFKIFNLERKVNIRLSVILGNEIHLDKNDAVGNKNENEEKTDGPGEKQEILNPIDSSSHCPVNENEDISRRCDQAKEIYKMTNNMPFGMFSVKKS